MKPSKLSPAELQVAAENIVNVRRAQGLTQVQLAAKAKVSVPSVFRAEKAQSVRLSTLRKIANDGLNIHHDTLLVPKKITVRSEIVVHRASNETWYAIADSRVNLPEDHQSRYQERNERTRLGQLGFVPGFMAPPTAIMKDGPGMALLELHSELLHSFNAEFYKDAVIYVLRGKAKLKIGTEEVEIGEGDWVGYPAADLNELLPAVEPGSPSYPALVLWIGANRITKKRSAKG
ncbi:MAG TPA: XRE family transcriptional regulator [Fimbriimonadaceae bacterium]|jgi:transcriptional regulator with XRE-family HTH domain